MADWLRERRRWPEATNPHLLITSRTYGPTASWTRPGVTADPVHLVRLFGIHPSIAVKYVHAVHPDKALPRIR